MALLNFDEKNEQYVYDVNKFSYDSEKIYCGYVSEEAAISNFKDAAAFAISNIKIINNQLVGDFQFINGKATELLQWIANFKIKTILNAEIDDETQEVTSASVHAFSAEPI